MSKIKVSELFYSVQGEGRYMGVPSIFLRTFGCNFRCKKFNRPKNEIIDGNNPEVDNVILNINQYQSYEDLPIINTGCDTYAAIYPAFKNLSPQIETNDIVDRILELLPYNEWRDEHLVITGGEPLLGWQRAYPDLLNNPKMHNLKEITFETNGTQEITSEFNKTLEAWSWPDVYPGFEREITFSVSPKLSVSGEKREEAIRPDIVRSYEEIGHTYLKFVVATEEDANEALEVTQLYRDAGFTGNVYLMPVGGVESVYAMNNKNVALLAMKHGLRYSDRLQVPLFKNAWAT
jgi:organic radical activating enzyme